MKQVITALIAMTCFAMLACEQGQAQVPKTVSVGFVNRSDYSVIVQGYTIVNGVQRRGQPLPLPTKGTAYEQNVPNGIRYITIYDRTNPARVLLRDFPVPVQGRDVFLAIVPSPLNPKLLTLMAVDPPN